MDEFDESPESHPLDFTDGFVQCGECGITIPVGEASPARRLSYKEDVDFVGHRQYGRYDIAVCPRCLRRIKRRNIFAHYQGWLVTLLIGGFVLVLSMCIISSLVRWTWATWFGR